MTKLRKVQNQASYPGNGGTVNDCWVVSAIAAKQAVAGGTPGKPSILTFRKAAGVPDLPGAAGGGDEFDAIKGGQKLWPSLRIKASSTKWETFVASLQQGWTADLMVDSSKLPAGRQFGFKGQHAIPVSYEDGKFWEGNPLAPQGSAPVPISEATLRAAAEGFKGDGKVHAALFNTPLPAPAPPVPPDVDPKDAEIEDLQDQLAAKTAEFEAYMAAELASDKAIAAAIELQTAKLRM